MSFDAGSFALSVKLENNDFLSTHLVCLDLYVVRLFYLQGKYPKRTLLYTGESLMINADKTMMDLVITNLTDNALKYSEDKVEIVLDGTRLRVIDHGIGIAAHELELISAKFYRVQKNSWDNSMGLGLSIVSYILKLHTTSLEISSIQGEGSTFGFSLDGLITKK
jgi:K+-sensing histidine kinase KdpD